ncbi:MAG: 4-(cytidine 5'-diphospho)-2-C-methyl-D-erythritol kinase [Balneolaceae bacterium]
MWLAYSHGKINLGLHVLERLPTGFHRIEAGFCFIEWNDRFEVDASDRYLLTITDSSIPADESNLITKAYRTFEKYVGLSRHYRFSVTKQIPAGAGLGGGSSNAALTMRILNKLEEAGLSDDELLDLSRPIGSDIAFFIKGKPGIGTGIGQDIEPLEIQPDHWIVTVFPGFESSTPEAYRYCEPNPEPEFPLKDTLTDEPVDEWRYLLQNDLEPPVIARNEVIGNLKDQFYEFGALYASMSGSGSSVFGIFEQDFVALHAWNILQDLGFNVNLTRPGFTPDRGIYLKE